MPRNPISGVRISSAPKMPKGATPRVPKAPAMPITRTPNVARTAMRTPRIPRQPTIRP